jgi:hypothetical protein
MSTPLAKKLGMKANMNGLVLSPPAGYGELLWPLPDGFRISSAAAGTYPFVQVFITRLAETAKCAKTFSKHAAPNALVWVAYPKKTSGHETDLNRDSIREGMAGLGWNTVSIVAIDRTWAALRFRPKKNKEGRN